MRWPDWSETQVPRKPPFECIQRMQRGDNEIFNSIKHQAGIRTCQFWWGPKGRSLGLRLRMNISFNLHFCRGPLFASFLLLTN